METRRLDYFIQIVDAGSITKAAARIGIAQPALSQQLAILEGEFKAKLLLRTAQGVEPTPAGAVLYRQAQSLLRQLRYTQDLLAQEDESPSGFVSLGLPTTTANLLTMPVVEAIRGRYPQIVLQVKEGLSADMADLVTRTRLDLAVLFTAGPVAGLEVTPLWIEDLLFVAPPDTELPRQIDIREAARWPLVMPAQGNGARDVLNAVLAKHSLTARVVAEIDSTVSLKRAVQRGIGCTFMPWAAIHEEVGRDEVTVTTIDDPEMVRVVSLCTPVALPKTRAMECVRNVIVEQAADLLHGRRMPGIRAPS
jgi:LysR family transcriptional regulator, nitrogen assimilation regulatory protein